jgi:PAS domain S-box-containing protein
MSAIPTFEESRRLQVLRTFQVLDTEPESEYDEITALAAQICGTPIALIFLLGENRQWFKSKFGLSAPETARGIAFCARALEVPGLLLVPDARTDPRFADNPGVVGEPFIRFYAGTPLVTSDGATLGTLCVIDRVPRELTAEQLRALGVLGRHLLRASEEKYRLLFAANPQPMWVYEYSSLRFLAVNAAAVRRYGYTEQQFLSMSIADIRTPQAAAELRLNLAQTAYVGKRNQLTRHLTADGTDLDVEITSENITFAGVPARLVLASDVSQRLKAERAAERAHRALQMLTRCNEALVRAASEDELLNAVCRIAVDVGGARMAWVGYGTDGPRLSLHCRAHAGEETEFVRQLETLGNDHAHDGRQPCFEALRTALPVVVADVGQWAADSAWTAKARAHGFQAAICLPLKANGRAFGVLTLYLAEAREIPPDELQLLQEMADDLTFGISAMRSQAERRRTQEAVLTMARGISTRAGAEFFRELTLRLTEALGAHIGSIAEMLPDRRGEVKTLSLVIGGEQAADLTYELAGSPCDQVGRSEVFVVRRDLPSLYPQAQKLTALKIEAYVGTRLLDAAGSPIGLMFAAFQQPLEQEDFVVSTLKIFAGRAAAELERQKVEVKTREQAALIDQSRDAISVLDLAHRITFWNRAAERLYGWTAAEAIGRPYAELLPSAPDRFAEADQAVLSTGEWNGEIHRHDRAGNALTLDARWTMLRDAHGQPQSILTVESDVTERRKMELQFLRTQRMESIGTLAGGIAHDLNNLLAPITMGVGLLKMFEPTPQALPILDSIEMSAARGARLVKQVLSFARGVEGARVAISLGHIVREVEGIAESSFPKNIEFASNVAPDLWLVLGDPTQLNQVILNLCVNARDAMVAGGRIEVAADNVEIDLQYAKMNRGMVPGRYVRLRVEDDGCGIPPAIIDRIFEPFFTTKELGKGTGLGLSTVQGIIRSHGGFIDVYSELGKGSTFRVHLPALADGTTMEIARVAEEQLPRGNGELILVVDDEPSIIDITTQTLQAFGYKTISAEDGAAAIALYAQRKGEIAAVITDMMMPVVDGPALIIALNRMNPQVLIIAASGLALQSGAAPAVQAGVKQFIPKPYSAEVLLRELKKILTS